jgi:hypothetical protein
LSCLLALWSSLLLRLPHRSVAECLRSPLLDRGAAAPPSSPRLRFLVSPACTSALPLTSFLLVSCGGTGDEKLFVVILQFSFSRLTISNLVK